MKELSNEIKVINFNNNSTIDFPNNDAIIGNLALNLDNEDDNEYSSPVAKKLVKIKPVKKIFMGCWQCCNEDSDNDGC